MEATLGCFAYCLDYFRDQISDVPNRELTAQPNGMANHPAWTIGHLMCSCQATGRIVGAAPWLPQSWAGRFGTGSQPSADRNAYESKSALLERLIDSEHRVTDAISRLSQAQLDQTLPAEPYGHAMPTVRHAINQMLIGHTANHIGQMTIWRRLMNLAPLTRHFL